MVARKPTLVQQEVQLSPWRGQHKARRVREAFPAEAFPAAGVVAAAVLASAAAAVLAGWGPCWLPSSGASARSQELE